MKLLKVLESKAKIRFQDCDPFNHLNNASYINYMINAREDQIDKHYNLDIFELAKTKGVSWVVGTNQIAYLKPALLMEEVTIDSQLIRYTENQLQVEIRMWNNDKTELKSVLWSTFVHFNLLKQKRWNHEQHLLELFKNVLEPLETKNFEERILLLKPLKV
ncbi:acyl-CoA thioesterase [Aquimarina muelleri]|uniref:Thioesterase n=1 Tax=Aquimarina muelleri TaxID=279356 RepID=A0A918N4A1_9FLAO|nr:acyl-CoA thioesterase [Aquimarina muelleri]MCX2763415.1 acyl-CoA thioesterase [Aquimarina muelleri]GGX28950.1 thioesterase [Aquimarina muelleri]